AFEGRAEPHGVRAAAHGPDRRSGGCASSALSRPCGRTGCRMECRASRRRRAHFPPARLPVTPASAWLRRLAFTFLVGVLLFGGLTARVLVEGEREIEKSDAAWNRGDLRDAALYARRSATLYAPGAPHVRAAYARLSAIAIG